MRDSYSRNNSETAASPKPTQHGRQLTNLGNLKHTAVPAGSSTGWREPLLGASVGLSLFLVAQLVSPSSRQLVLSQSDPQQLGLFTLGKKVPSESGQFLGVPEAILNCSPYGL